MQFMFNLCRNSISCSFHGQIVQLKWQRETNKKIGKKYWYFSWIKLFCSDCLHFDTCGHVRNVCKNVYTWTMTVDTLAKAPASAVLCTIEPPSSACSALKRETEVDAKGTTPPPSKCTPNCEFGCFHWETRQTFVDHKSPAQSCPAVELLWAERQY